MIRYSNYDHVSAGSRSRLHSLYLDITAIEFKRESYH